MQNQPNLHFINIQKKQEVKVHIEELHLFLYPIIFYYQGVTELDNVVNSAANYWINKKQYKQSGNNRPMFEYNISNRC